MHEVLAAAFEVLHFERFSDKEEAVEEIIDLVKLKINIINNNRHNKHKNIETDCSVHSKEAGEILDRYDKWHNRYVRSGDFEVYIACFPEITSC